MGPGMRSTGGRLHPPTDAQGTLWGLCPFPGCPRVLPQHAGQSHGASIPSPSGATAWGRDPAPGPAALAGKRLVPGLAPAFPKIQPNGTSLSVNLSSCIQPGRSQRPCAAAGRPPAAVDGCSERGCQKNRLLARAPVLAGPGAAEAPSAPVHAAVMRSPPIPSPTPPLRGCPAVRSSPEPVRSSFLQVGQLK